MTPDTARFAVEGSFAWEDAWKKLHEAMQSYVDRYREIAWDVLNSETSREGNLPTPLGLAMCKLLASEKPPENDYRMESLVLPGEIWQYMGTFLRSAGWEHQFRHRCFDLGGGRNTVVNFPADIVPPGPKPQLALTGGRKFEDDGSPF